MHVEKGNLPRKKASYLGFRQKFIRCQLILPLLKSEHIDYEHFAFSSFNKSFLNSQAKFPLLNRDPTSHEAALFKAVVGAARNEGLKRAQIVACCLCLLTCPPETSLTLM